MDGEGRTSLKTYLKVLVNLGIILLLLLFCIFVLPRIVIYFMPFVIGWIIALIASPLVRFFEKKLKIRRKAGSAFVIIAVIALVILAGYFVGSKLVTETVDFVAEIPEMWQGTQQDFDEIAVKLEGVTRLLPIDISDKIATATDNIEAY